MGRRQSPMESVELSFYKGKKIFLTGHTGFKGAWLALWLKNLGADVTGYALPPEDNRGNFFNLIHLKDLIKSTEADIKDQKKLKKNLEKHQPEFIFHLAAQPLVLRSYDNPIETYDTNVMGTINILETARKIECVKAIVIITTDKCYENKNWIWPYRETDILGGHDPYSSSKAMTELAAISYYNSFFKRKNIGVATARAGNVIGGGDFSAFRIIPDIVEAISKNEAVILRNPYATRPWLYILDVLYGYMLLGKKLFQEPKKFSTPFNFAPKYSSDQYTVEYITKKFIHKMERGSYRYNDEKTYKHEASYLQLDANKARSLINWQPALSTEEAIQETAKWYNTFLDNKKKTYDLAIKQIAEYSSLLEKI